MNTIPSPSAYLAGQPVPSPACVQLNQAGVSTATVAHKLGCSRMAVSHYLAGNRAAPRQLRSVLVALVGVHAAGLIIDAIPERKAAP